MQPDPFSLFFGNDQDVLTDVKESCALMPFDKGATLLAQEDDDDEVFILLEGTVKAVVFSADGHEIWLDDFGPGEIFGEMAAIGGFERTSNVIAITDITVAIFPAEKFLGLMKRHGPIGLKVSETLVHRMRPTTRRMFELTSLSAPGRIYAELLRQSKPNLEYGRMERTISPPPVKAVFAKQVNSTRETVSRVISDLEQRGLVIDEGKALIITAPKKLRDLIS